MTREPDQDDLEEAADEAFDLLDQAMGVSGADDEIETSIENEDVVRICGTGQLRWPKIVVREMPQIDRSQGKKNVS